MNERRLKYIAQLKSLNLPMDDDMIQKSADAFEEYDEHIYKKLIKIGYPDGLNYPTLTAYIDELKPFENDFIEIVLEAIPFLKHKSGAVSFLRESKRKYDGRVLIQIFDNATKSEKWTICDAIVHNPPLNIEEWTKQTFLSKKYNYEETGLLPLAIVKMFPKDQAREILKAGFDHHYRVTPTALGKVGKKEDIPFLEERLNVKYDASHVHKDIEKAIAKIKKRK